MKARKKLLARFKKKPPRAKPGAAVESKKQAPARTATTLAPVTQVVALAAPAAAPSLSPAPIAASTRIVAARPTAGAAPGLSGAADAYQACGMTAQVQRYLTSVNGLSSGAAFTPDSTYKIAGCGFGTKKGTVALTGDSSGGMFNVSLLIESWANDAIGVRVDPKLSGVADQTNVVLVVTPSEGGALQQGGHSFVAATEEVVLKSVPPAWLVSSSLRQPATVKSPAPNGTTLEVSNYFEAGTQFCPREVTTDVLHLSQLVLKNGYWVDRATVENLLPQDLTQPADPSPSLFHNLGFGWNGDDLQVSPQWLEWYFPKNLFVGGYSHCDTRYRVTVYLRGPRGLPPQ
jgi:hypothetical protein